MSDEKAPAALGINVAEGIRVKEQFGKDRSVRAHAIGLLAMREDGSLYPIRYSFLNPDKSEAVLEPGKKYTFTYAVEVR